MNNKDSNLKTAPLDSIQIALLSLIQSEAEDLIEREGKRPQLRRIIEASRKMFNGATAQSMNLLPEARRALADLEQSEIACLLNRVFAENPVNPTNLKLETEGKGTNESDKEEDQL